MRAKVALLGTVCVLAVSGTAHASGWYVGLEAGASWIADNDVDVRATSAGLTTFNTIAPASFDGGWAIIAAVGYGMQGWRVEGELGWRKNDKDQFTPLPFSTGDLNEVTAMLNLSYEIPLGQKFGVVVGGGAGIDYAMLDIPTLDDSDLNFAYQGIVGLNFALSPNTELTLNYRYLHVLDPEFEERANPGLILKFEDLSKHALTAGVRFSFAP